MTRMRLKHTVNININKLKYKPVHFPHIKIFFFLLDNVNSVLWIYIFFLSTIVFLSPTGSGLGKTEHGMCDPIKVTLKMDKAGVSWSP